MVAIGMQSTNTDVERTLTESVAYLPLVNTAPLGDSLAKLLRVFTLVPAYHCASQSVRAPMPARFRPRCATSGKVSKWAFIRSDQLDLG